MQLYFFAATLFVSALLLFLVQPMIGKMVLPRLGGTPAVWNTCMVFFQAMLLAGYGYVHALTSWPNRRGQLLVQGLLVLTPLAVLPFALPDWALPTESSPVLALLGQLLIVVGLPFFVVATSAPLLQRWFGDTGHPAARDPYFLYAASNLGSMLALLLYPAIVEPSYGVDAQARLWMYGYYAFAALVLGATAVVGYYTLAPRVVAAVALPELVAVNSGTEIFVRPAEGRESFARVMPVESEDEAISVWRYLRWIGLAAAPSSLMLGVTTYMTTDIAAVPLLWILPLALYLLTFILAFLRWPVDWTKGPHDIVLYLQPCAALVLLLKMLSHLTPIYWPTVVEFTIHLGAFFLTALLCHGELAKDRPGPRHLTAFYLCLSLGGVLGGLFNALLAPVVFQYGLFEYLLAMIFAYLLRPNLVSGKPLIPGDSTRRVATPLGAFFDLGLAATVFVGTLVALHSLSRMAVLAVAVCAIFLAMARPIRFALAMLALCIACEVTDRVGDRYVFEARGFFGRVRARDYHRHVPRPERWAVQLAGVGHDPWAALAASPLEDEHKEWRVYRTLIHGGINHGTQIVEPATERRRPISYFHPNNGIGEIFRKFSWSDARLPASLIGFGTTPWGALVDLHSEPPYAVVGLGTGTLACHARPFQTAHLYEIDPLVRYLSLPGDGTAPTFNYVQDALDRQANLRVILGDGRLQIAYAPDHYYHIILLDAFSSDAIPVHLLTADAVDRYLEKLADGGILVFNTTNRYVRIEPVLSAIGAARDLDVLACSDRHGGEDCDSADWLVLQRRSAKNGVANGGPPIGVRLDRDLWQPVEPLEGPVWTDDYSDLLHVMRWR